MTSVAGLAVVPDRKSRNACVLGASVGDVKACECDGADEGETDGLIVGGYVGVAVVGTTVCPQFM